MKTHQKLLCSLAELVIYLGKEDEARKAVRMGEGEAGVTRIRLSI